MIGWRNRHHTWGLAMSAIVPHRYVARGRSFRHYPAGCGRGAGGLWRAVEGEPFGFADERVAGWVAMGRGRCRG